MRKLSSIMYGVFLITALLIAFLSCQQKTETAIVDLKQGIDSVASSDGVPIYYEVTGKGSLALVMVHCWCCDRDYWRNQVDEFSAKYTIVTIDLAGHGQSGLDREIWSMGSYGEDVAVVVNKLGLEKIILIGHSMGGSVIIEAARRLPGKVIGLVGVDTYNDLTQKYTFTEMDEFLQPFKENFSNTTRLFVQGMFGEVVDSSLASWIRNDMAEGPPNVGIGSFQYLFPYYFGETINNTMKEINLPVRCINSDKYPTNLAAGRAAAKSFEVKIMPGVGHFVHLEDPETFNRLLHETLDELIALED